MTLVRVKTTRPANGNINNFIDDVFNQFPSLFRTDSPVTATKYAVPVNIRETDKNFQLEFFAAGYNKEDFKIELDNNQLIISAEGKNETEEGKYVRREHTMQPFKRSFNLDEKIDAENISAQYVNGVLTLNLPKRQEVKPSSKQITIQ